MWNINKIKFDNDKLLDLLRTYESAFNTEVGSKDGISACIVNEHDGSNIFTIKRVVSNFRTTTITTYKLFSIEYFGDGLHIAEDFRVKIYCMDSKTIEADLAYNNIDALKQLIDENISNNSYWKRCIQAVL